MKKLLITLLSLNLYGADKPKTEFDKHGNLVTNIRAELNFSKKGLEGWGKKEGVRIIVEDYTKHDKTFDKKAIENQVELKLRLAGIKVVQGLSYDSIDINMRPSIVGGRVIGYGIRVIPQRTMTFKYNGKEYIAVSSSNVVYGGGTGINYRPFLDNLLDQLLLDYLKANPKPKEKKSLIEP